MAADDEQPSDLDSWLTSQVRQGIGGWRPGPQALELVLIARRRRIERLRRNVLAGSMAMLAFGLFLYTLVPSPGGTAGALVATLVESVQGSQPVPVAVSPPHERSTAPVPPSATPPPTHWHRLKEDPAGDGPEAVSRPGPAPSSPSASPPPVVAGPRDPAQTQTTTTCYWGVMCVTSQGNGSMTPQQLAQLAQEWAAQHPQGSTRRY